MKIFHIVPEDRKFPPQFILQNMGYYETCDELEDVLTYLRLWKKLSKKQLPKGTMNIDEELIEGMDLVNTDQKFISLKLTYEVKDGQSRS